MDAVRGSAAAAAQDSTPTPTPTGFEGDPLPGPAWLPEFIPLFVYRLVAAVAVVLFAIYFARIIRQVLGRRIARRYKRPSVSRTILRSIQILIVLAGIVVGLGFFGLEFGNVALSVGVFSAVVGVILAPIIGNVLSGVFILSEQPYEIGDMIELEDTNTQGFVEDVTLLYTKIFTLDNTFIVLPNGAMRERDVTNFSAEDTRTRQTLDVGVTYESDIDTAREQMEAAARDVDGVIQGGPDIRIGSARYPASPRCYIREFGDSEVLLRLRYWAREPYKQTALQSRVLTNVWERFDRHDIEIPYPHSHVVFDDTSGELQVAMREAAEDVESRPGGATSRATDAPAEGDSAGATESSGDGTASPADDDPTSAGRTDGPDEGASEDGTGEGGG